MTPLASSQAIVLRAIAAAADANAVCPTNIELGELVAGGSTVACGAMKALQKKGFITVERFAHTRRVTIVATGRATRHDGSTVPHWRSRQSKVAAPTSKRANA